MDRPGKSPAQIRSSFEADIAFLQKGYHTIISNHPDMSFDYLKEIEGLMPRDGRLNWTARQAAEWWQRTHDRRALNLQSEAPLAEGKAAFALYSRDGVDGVVVRLIGAQSREGHIKTSSDLTLLDSEWEDGGLRLAFSCPAGRHRFILV